MRALHEPMLSRLHARHLLGLVVTLAACVAGDRAEPIAWTDLARESRRKGVGEFLSPFLAARLV